MYTDYVYPAFVSLLADISCLLYLFRKCCCFVFLSFPLLLHYAFFFLLFSLVYWPFRTRLLACLIRAAILHFSCRLHLLHPDGLSSVVLSSDLLYQSATFVFLDGSQASEGLVRVS